MSRSNGSDHAALELLEDGRIDPASILSHRYLLSEGHRAFATMGEYADGVIKPWIEL